MQAYIPSTWAMSNIGAIADVVAGGTPKADDKSNFSAPGTGFAWLTPADLSGYMEKYISHGSRDLSEKGLTTSSAKLMPAGALLFSSRAPIGYVAIAANEISTNQGFKNFVFSNEILSTYAYYYLKSIRGLAESLGTGTTFKEISGATAKTLPFVIPPFAEQKEISDRLDILMAQVEATQARLARIPDIIKRFRQSVLTAAVGGKLTEEWRERNKLPSPKEIKLDQIICEGPQNGLYKAQSFYGDGVRIIRIDGFYDGEIVGWHKVKRLSLEDSEYSKWKLEVGDILVNRVNSIEYLGKSAIVRELPEPAVFESNIMKFRVNPDEAIPEYIVKFLCSTTGISQLRQNAKLAVNQASINQQDVKNCQVYLPISQEQTEIVRRVEQLFAYADNIEQQAIAAKERVDKLTQAILAKAFRGELTANWRAANPELISGDNGAAALLARIQAERAAVKPRKSRRV